MINLDNLNFVNWDYPAIYEGVMSPENNFIMIIQNFWMTVTSSIGYIFLIPFFEVIYNLYNKTVFNYKTNFTISSVLQFL